MEFIIENGILKQYTGLGGHVEIPDEVVEIGFQAFFKNTSVTGITLPKGLKKIGMEAFLGNISIKEIVFPEGLEVFEQEAFYGCNGLKTVKLPASVRKLGEWHADVFECCENLVRIEVDANNKKYQSVDGILYSKDLRNLYFCPDGKEGTVEVLDSVTTIHDQAFTRCKNLIAVSLPESVKKIGYYCFSGCKKLNTIVIPDKVEKIYDGTFEGCETLSHVSLPESLLNIETRAFWGCNKLNGIHLPVSVTKIGKDAFSNHTVVYCNDQQFKKLSEGVRLRSVVGYVHDKSVEYKEVVSKYIKKYGEQLLEIIVDINDAVALNNYFELIKKVDVYTLDKMIDRASIDHKNQVLDILNSKKSISHTDNESEKKERSVSEWRKIFKYNFNDDGIVITGYKADDVKVEIPSKIGKNTVVAIGDKAFYNCQQITEVILPDTIQQICVNAFYYCRRLESITIQNGLTTIDKRAFELCSSLKSISLPSTIVSIAPDAFAYCSITIHAEQGSYIENYANEKGIPFISK